MSDTLDPKAGESGPADPTPAPEQGEPKPGDTNLPAKEKESVTEPEEVFELEGVERTEDGQLELKRGTIIYRGKTPQELIENMAKGLEAKETHIKNLETQRKVELPEKFAKGDTEPTSKTVEAPDRETIYGKHAKAVQKRSGVDPAMFTWTNTQWREYADENGMRDFEVTQRQNLVHAALQEIDERTEREYAEANVKFVNVRTVEDEDQSVRELIAEADIDVKDFDYDAVLTRVFNDPNSKYQWGGLKPGRIVKEASKEIRRIQSGTSESVMRQKIEEDIAVGRKKKTRVRVGAGSTEQFKSTAKVPKDYEDALEQAIQYANENQR